jgi:hypothetical protein
MLSAARNGRTFIDLRCLTTGLSVDGSARRTRRSGTHDQVTRGENTDVLESDSDLMPHNAWQASSDEPIEFSWRV